MSSLWLTILAAGAVTYLLRLSFIAIHGRVAMPAWFLRALAFVPVAVLSALIFPEVLASNGVFDATLGNARVPAAIAAVVVAWRTRSVWATIAVGMVVLVAWQVIFRP